MYPGSIVQVAEHPSPPTLLPSSHASPPTMPSPHFDAHAPPEQSGSARQSPEQPSNGSGLPSSQLSVPSTLPSPHVVCVQVLGAPLHFQPSSTLQVAEQPSPAVVLPSSHSSGSTTTPSPQRATRWHGLPGGVHEKPGSTTRQSAVQPSTDSRLPSSHASSEVRSPLPHMRGSIGWPRSIGVMRPSVPVVPPPLVPPPPPSVLSPGLSCAQPSARQETMPSPKRRENRIRVSLSCPEGRAGSGGKRASAVAAPLPGRDANIPGSRGALNCCPWRPFRSSCAGQCCGCWPAGAGCVGNGR